jgi:two-component system chemotaxis sensor kinase CheA
MAEPDPRWQQLRAAFSAELEERVRELNQLLLRLEQSEGAERGDTVIFDALFREAHSLKGAARAVELGHLEGLAHAIESSLDGARRRDERPPARWFDAVYRAVDMLDTLGGLAGDDG